MARRMGLVAARDFCRRFGTAFRAGVDIVSLCRAESRHGTTRQQQVMAAVADEVADGSSLADAMLHAGSGFFPRLMIAMVRLGEQTGRLERTLLQLADHYQHRVATRRMFYIGIAWPMFQLGAATLIIGALIWILGILQPSGGGEMFDPTGLGLRGNRGVLIYFSLVGVVVAAMCFAYQAVRRNWFNLHAAVPILYVVPRIGPALQTITLARFTWTLAMGLDAGLDPARSVELAMDSTDSDYYRSETPRAAAAIERGKTLGEALAATGVFPDEFLNQVEVAELSGTDAESLGHLAADYDERAKMAVRTIAGIATVVIWLAVVVLLVTMILRMVMNVAGVYRDALEM